MKREASFGLGAFPGTQLSLNMLDTPYRTYEDDLNYVAFLLKSRNYNNI